MNQSAQAYSEHNHQHYIEQALTTAKTLCNRRGARFTHLREKVFTLIWHSHKPLGAYTILEKLVDQGTNRRSAPPTVYRAPEFLQQQGLVHRITSLNAFIGCNHPQYLHDCQFLICKLCDTTLELENPALQTSMLKEAEAAGFATESALVEVLGLCPNCQSKGDKP